MFLRNNPISLEFSLQKRLRVYADGVKKMSAVTGVDPRLSSHGLFSTKNP